MRRINTRRLFNIFLAIVIVEIFVGISARKTSGPAKYNDAHKTDVVNNGSLVNKDDNDKKGQVNLRSIGWSVRNTLQSDSLKQAKRFD
ncbi:hypothetical protein BEL04_18335 [Mucilaginibacter sp. PPCGB 2223]|uniref:hypothetical protein n=1 Tax=Mucilaginibacter sp. PPCGB 2223 TaxID=1886027 RepID=UPI0008260B0D|nr:hypothetical protein [Mucilaginibacter sp. PPCGB 2223]OCX51957.1 hypothetical protein BEL04_18335 [Mucilaginibacter sp. PPCGB 2223]